jgi:hypothetical protein
MTRCPLLRGVFVRQSRRTTAQRVGQGYVTKTPKWMCCTRGGGETRWKCFSIHLVEPGVLQEHPTL